MVALKFASLVEDPFIDLPPLETRQLHCGNAHLLGDGPVELLKHFA